MPPQQRVGVEPLRKEQTEGAGVMGIALRATGMCRPSSASGLSRCEWCKVGAGGAGLGGRGGSCSQGGVRDGTRRPVLDGVWGGRTCRGLANVITASAARLNVHGTQAYSSAEQMAHLRRVAHGTSSHDPPPCA